MKNTPTSTQPANMATEYLTTLHEAENNVKNLRHLLRELIELFPQVVAALRSPSGQTHE